MIKRLLAVSSSAIVLLGAIALPAFAASVDSATNAAASAATDVGTGVSGSVTGSGSVSTGGSNTGTQGSVNANTGTGAYGSASNTNGSGSVGVSADTSANGSGTISLSSSDQAVTDFDASSNQNVSDATMVQSNDQLSAYAAGTLHADPNIKGVQLSSNSVAMDYKENGHFLGFIPSHVTTHAQVDQDGTVSVSYPWYHFLVSTDDANLKSDIQSRTQATLSAQAGGSLSAQTQAKLMADIYAAFSGK